MKQRTAKYINVNGRLMDLSRPQVMGILNLTPDSFYAGSRKQTEQEIACRTNQIISEGGSIIDVGAYSSRPNAADVPVQEEMERLRKGLAVVFREQPEAVVSVDTFRADVAKMCVEEFGVAIINDIAAGEMDKDMFHAIARLGVPYIMMHMQGTPQNMQRHPHYDHLLKEVICYFRKSATAARHGSQRPDHRPGIRFRENAGPQLRTAWQNGRTLHLRPPHTGGSVSQVNDIQPSWRNARRRAQRNDGHKYNRIDERGGHPARPRRKARSRSGENCINNERHD